MRIVFRQREKQVENTTRKLQQAREDRPALTSCSSYAPKFERVDYFLGESESKKQMLCNIVDFLFKFLYFFFVLLLFLINIYCKSARISVVPIPRNVDTIRHPARRYARAKRLTSHTTPSD